MSTNTYIVMLATGVLSLAMACSSGSRKVGKDSPQPQVDGDAGDGDATEGDLPGDGAEDGNQVPPTGGDDSATGDDGAADGDDGVADGDDGAADGGEDNPGTGGSDGGDGDPATGTEIPSELLGRWRSECLLLVEGDNEDSAISEVRFLENGTLKAYFYQFSDDACQTPHLTSAIVATVLVRDPVSAPVGARAIDYTIEKIGLRPDSAGAALSLNGHGGFCGLSGWEKGVWKNVTGEQDCEKDDTTTIKFSKTGDVIEDVFKTQADAGLLFLGIEVDETGGSVIAERPTAFNDLTYTLQVD